MRYFNIFDFLKWVYGEELPKAKPQGAKIAQFGSVERAFDCLSNLGVIIDDQPKNQYGLAFDKFTSLEPHAAAVKTYDIVMNLNQFEWQFKKGYDFICELGDFTNSDLSLFEKGQDLALNGKRLTRVSIEAMIINTAILGKQPLWQFEAPALKWVAGKNGKPLWFIKEAVEFEGSNGIINRYDVEVDGMDSVTKRPKAGAYHKRIYTPCPSLIIAARMEYQCWVMALEAIEAEINAGFKDIQITRGVPPIAPWIGYNDHRRQAA
jgi:hypothetical protein